MSIMLASMIDRFVAAISLRVVQLWFSWGPIYWTQWLWDFFKHAAQDGYEWQTGVARSYIRESAQMTIYEPIDASLGGPTKGFVLYAHGGGFCCTSCLRRASRTKPKLTGKRARGGQCACCGSGSSSSSGPWWRRTAPSASARPATPGRQTRSRSSGLGGPWN